MTEEIGSTDLVRLAAERGLLPFLAAAVRNLDAVATGALGAGKLQLLMIPGRLVQAARNKSFLEQLSREIQTLRERGRLRPDVNENPEVQSSLQELLAGLEDAPVDDTKFQVLKNIFIAAATQQIPNEIPPQLVLGIARALSSGELITLATAYRVARDRPDLSKEVQGAAEKWVAVIADKSGIGLHDLVDHYAHQLAEKHLIYPRHWPDKSGMHIGEQFGLTDLGAALCELVERGASEVQA